MRRKAVNHRLDIVLGLRVLAVLVVVTLVLLYFFCQTLLRRKFDKLVLVINGREEGVVVEVYDFYRLETLRVVIPNQTEVELAQNLGVMKLGNVWQLGQGNGSGGRLLSETVALNWRWPVNAWGDSLLLTLTGGSVGKKAKIVFGRLDSNLSRWDRLLLGLCSLKLKPSHQQQYDLFQGGELTLTQLADGTLGYRPSNREDYGRLLGAFTFERLEATAWKVQIVNASGSSQAGNRLGEIVQTMGLKVAFVNQVSPEDGTCRISSGRAGLSGVLSRVLGCSLIRNEVKDDFDLTVYLGQKHFLNNR